MTTPIPTGWKPIESAPEGVMILCANMNAREARDWAFVAWMASGKVCGHRMDKPTHWMPLPAAPDADTPEEPITVALDPDPRGVSVGVWQGSHCIYTGAHAVPVAPGDAQAVAWMDPETLDVISAERKASWLSNYGIGGANKAARYTRALGDFRPAPAAGDARADRNAAFEAVRKRLCALHRYSFRIGDHGGVKRVKDRSGGWIDFDAAHELFDPVAVDAAIAAQQGKGGEA